MDSGEGPSITMTVGASASTTISEQSVEEKSDTDTEEVNAPKSPKLLDITSLPLDFSDPADWPDVITKSCRDTIVMKGPAKPN